MNHDNSDDKDNKGKVDSDVIAYDCSVSIEGRHPSNAIL